MIDQIAGFFDGNSLPVKVIIVIVSTLVLSLISRGILSILDRRFDNTETPWDDAFIKSAGTPIRLLIWVVGITLAIQISGVVADTPSADLVVAVRHIGVIFAIAWFLIRFIGHGQKNLIERKIKKDGNFDQTALDSIGKILRLIVFIIAIMVVLQTLGFSISGLLAFGGVGGIAIGFAAKDMLSNFFGGLMIYLDRPFALGDWIRSPDREIEGVVEQIGWRITLIRTLESRALYVPNSSFTTISIENISRMTNRRIYETIGIRYDDAGCVTRIVEQVTEYLKSHDGIDQNQSLTVSFTTFAPSSLDFFIYCFTKTQVGIEFYKIKQQVMLHILKIIEDNGAECAFPTTTVHVQGAAAQVNNTKTD